ncbi:MAG: tyrosine-protein phosphatase [Bacteroidales bacterium]|nr:tyrosine-protein phosphatase [Bacteroidales bacterium]
MRYRFLLIGVLAALAVSCSVEEVNSPVQESHNAPVFYATIDDSQPGGTETKVYTGEDLKVLWNADDRITVFNKNTYNKEFVFTGDDGDNSGSFEEVTSDSNTTSTKLDKVYAVYPYRESTEISDDGIITLTLPSEQAFRANSFGSGANAMVATTAEDMLKFKNVGGYLLLKFYGEGISISSITVRGNNEELLAGKCTVDMSSGLPVLAMDESQATDAVTLACDPPVSLGSSSSETVACWLVLPPVTFTSGFTVTVTTSDGGVFEKSTSKKTVITRSAVTRFAALEVKIPAKYVRVPVFIEGGTYLIAAVTDDKIFKGAVDGSAELVSPVDDVITETDKSLSAYEFTIENDGSDYYLRYSDGKYLVCDYSTNNGNTSTGIRYIDTKEQVAYPYRLTVTDGTFFFDTPRTDNGAANQYVYYKTQDNANVFKIGQSGSSIGVHLYLKLGTGDSPIKQSQTLSFIDQSVTWTLGKDCETGKGYDPQEAIGAQTNVSYSCEPEDVAVIEDGKIKIVGPGSATITASAEETDDYYPASATYVLLIRRGPSQEWVDMGSVSLENDALSAYLDDAIRSYSDTDDATNTVMAAYATGSAYSSIDRKDCPNPVKISLANAASSSTVIAIYEDSTMINPPIWSQNATLGSTSADVYNLIPGRTYYYAVIEDSVVWEKGYFNTTGRRRMIKVSNVERTGHANNCRDLGGLEVNDKGTKKTIKYGYIFRGTNMDKTTDTEKALLTGFLNIGVDIDLRSGKASSPGNDNGNQNCYQPFASSYEVGYINPGFNSFNDLTDTAKVKSVITAIFNTAKKDKASYFHCYIGADRTGYIAMLIEGLLGVSEKDCSIDYELTSFSEAAELRYRNGQPRDYYFRKGIQFLRDQEGETFQDKIENYLVKTVGISEADIKEFKSIVLK